MNLYVWTLLSLISFHIFISKLMEKTEEVAISKSLIFDQKSVLDRKKSLKNKIWGSCVITKISWYFFKLLTLNKKFSEQPS